MYDARGGDRFLVLPPFVAAITGGIEPLPVGVRHQRRKEFYGRTGYDDCRGSYARRT